MNKSKNKIKYNKDKIKITIKINHITKEMKIK